MPLFSRKKQAPPKQIAMNARRPVRPTTQEIGNYTTEDYLDMNPNELAAEIESYDTPEELIAETKKLYGDYEYIGEIIGEMNNYIEELGGTPEVYPEGYRHYEPEEDDLEANIDTSDLEDIEEIEDEEELAKMLAGNRRQRNNRKATQRPKDEAAWLAMAPNTNAVQKYRARLKHEEEYRASLVDTIINNSIRAKWNKAQLANMDIEQLSNIVADMGATAPQDIYGIRGMQVAVNENQGVPQKRRVGQRKAGAK